MKQVPNAAPSASWHDRRIIARVIADIQYAGYIDRQMRDWQRLIEQDQRPLPTGCDYAQVHGLRREAQQTLNRFRPATLGQAGRLAGITPADVMLISVALRSPLPLGEVGGHFRGPPGEGAGG